MGSPPHQWSEQLVIIQKETAVTFIDAYVSVLLDSYIIDISVYLQLSILIFLKELNLIKSLKIEPVIF